jgi:hypothetical protein
VGLGVQEHIPIDEVFQQLRCNKEGLTDEEGDARLKIFGHNKLEEKSVRWGFWSFVCFFFVWWISAARNLKNGFGVLVNSLGYGVASGIRMCVRLMGFLWWGWNSLLFRRRASFSSFSGSCGTLCHG